MTADAIATLTGSELLDWLASRGARFCKVAAWNDQREWVQSPGKQPLGKNWEESPLDIDQVRDHLSDGGNVGLLTGKHSNNLCILDADENFTEFITFFSILAKAPTIIRAGADKGKIIIRIKGQLPSSRTFKHSPTDRAPFLEFLSTGRQGVAAGIHPTGNTYQLINAENPIPELSGETVSDYCAIWTGKGLEDDEAQQAPTELKPVEQSYSGEGDGLRELVLAAWPTFKIFQHFGKVDKTRIESRGEWMRLFGNGGLFVHMAGGQPDNHWNCRSDEMGGGPFEAWWWCKTGSTNVPRDGRFYDLLKEMAQAANLPMPERRNGYHKTASATLSQELPTGSEEPNTPFLLTELGNSRRFSKTFQEQALHVQAWGWMIWNGQRWEIDETGRSVEKSKQVVDNLFTEAQAALSEAQSLAGQMRDASEEERQALKMRVDIAQQKAEKLLKWAMQSQTAQKINAILSLAESDLPARVDDFDADPWLLNCENGVVDLRTEQLLEHSPSRRITKIAGTRFDPSAQCPTWLLFLKRVFEDNEELITFVQRAAGYSLTGNINEQVMFFLYGTGKNGKSVFCETLQALLGDYARRTPTDTLMLKRLDEGVPNDIARLPGARAVIAAELAEGKRLNESLVKDLTGGDRITARFLRKEFFEFSPTFKLWMYGNHKPTIRGTDEGIWRRVRVVPFTVTIPESERDPNLVDKLRAELPGILFWALQGCQAWQKNGLGLPAAVRLATENYRAEQDLLAAFLEECCLVGALRHVTAGDLYSAYKKWSEENGETPLTHRKFSQALTERGFTVGGREGGTGRRVYNGLGLITPPEEN